MKSKSDRGGDGSVGPNANDLKPPPTTFNLIPHLNTWFRWERVATCFWPRGAGYKTSVAADAELAPVVRLGGVYILARSRTTPPQVHPADARVIYVGETLDFKRRMGDLRNSAGLRAGGVRSKGHSAGWRVEVEQSRLWVAFFPVPWPRDQSHLGEGLRKWIEAVAIEEHRVAHGALPIVNAGERAADAVVVVT